jgi:alkylation response protein AidB-like acyl-CoA dehydrogenase
LLNGTKNWITNGYQHLHTLVIAQTDIEDKGINAFIVEKVGLDLMVQKKRKWEFVDLIHIH